MQFLQLYGRQKLNASLLKVQQQKNLVDCGVFAIAFCTEYCYTGRKVVLQDEFDIMRMRDHLHNCIENMELTPFPKLRRKLKLLTRRVGSAGVFRPDQIKSQTGDVVFQLTGITSTGKQCDRFFKVLTKTTDPKLISTDVFDRQLAVIEITAHVQILRYPITRKSQSLYRRCISLRL